MDKRQKILIVDDAEFNREILKEFLGEAYSYLEAENGIQAIRILEENPEIDLMLLDVNMPQMNGFEVLEWMNQLHWIDETPVIMISSEGSVDAMRKAYEMGITDYITRPFDSVIVKKRVQNTLELYANQKRLISVVVDQVYEKEENSSIMIRILSNVLGFRNSESSEHILHIRTATEMMLRKLVKTTDVYHLTETDIAMITTASSLHDIGKIGIPEGILNKPGRLTDEEFKIMKTHSEIGASLIRDMNFSESKPLIHTAWEICRWHHERWDGKGYPDGLKGEEIPISAQVVSIVDVYDALTSERCYKKAFDHDTAVKMILEGQCGQFNPILLKCLKELSLQFSKMFTNETDDNKQYYEAQRLSDEILKEKSLPRKNYSQRVIELMQEKIEFFKTDSGKISIEYNAISGRMTIINGNRKILCQRDDSKFDIFKLFEVSNEDIQHIRELLEQTSIQNKEISLKLMAKVENKRQMYDLKLHTLWSPLKKDGYIGIVGYIS
ncbi:HD domain-containing phosphohydrolase [Ruminococcus sp. AF31-8BH]|uniref:HD domain-containing phosphohydrolase n=1 Tax=Ruminococcus sp. AF31-8BH TaxID=2293174 RepID=UPI000E4C9E23|nr:HD domain-containing phosphohydrolase [Ruminococcus sp. AF31-8BH]RGF70185.1 response regulator [Ruminococcus sp. AF31-8BH]